MFTHQLGETRIEPSRTAASALTALLVSEYDSDRARVAIPRPESTLVVRFGPSTRGGLDVHAAGSQQKVRRKLIRSGQRAITARLQLGASAAVLGVPAATLAGRIVALEDLWGSEATRTLLEQLADAASLTAAARVLETTIAERFELARASRRGAPLARAAAQRLTRTEVSAVATDLGVSERHLRRVFRDAVGLSPKAFAKLARFHRALRASRDDAGASWASIASSVGYYDQAHLIADFRAIAGVTPQALLEELGAAPPRAAQPRRRTG